MAFLKKEVLGFLNVLGYFYKTETFGLQGFFNFSSPRFQCQNGKRRTKRKTQKLKIFYEFLSKLVLLKMAKTDCSVSFFSYLYFAEFSRETPLGREKESSTHINHLKP